MTGGAESTSTPITLHDLCERYRLLYMPAVCDALFELHQEEKVLPTWLRPLFPEQRIVGEAFTVEGHDIPDVGWDEGIIRMRSYLDMFEQLTPDSLLVSTTPGGRVGHFGELTANAARAHGCVGMILDGNLRDIEGLREIGFQVFYRDLSPLNGIGRWEMIASQQPVAIGGVVVNPGDIVFGEFDGILIIPRPDALAVLEKAEEIVGAEGRVRAEVRGGDSPWSSFERHGHI
jgi:4-hydroxy-4-methyl-2-oxoglutarate aldolase